MLASQLTTKIAKYLPIVAELWVAGIIVTFLTIRILGSNTFQHLLRRAGH
jgi:hypothetical protein